jgi:hypothetical protein
LSRNCFYLGSRHILLRSGVQEAEQLAGSTRFRKIQSGAGYAGNRDIEISSNPRSFFSRARSIKINEQRYVSKHLNHQLHRYFIAGIGAERHFSSETRMSTCARWDETKEPMILKGTRRLETKTKTAPGHIATKRIVVNPDQSVLRLASYPFPAALQRTICQTCRRIHDPRPLYAHWSASLENRGGGNVSNVSKQQ